MMVMVVVVAPSLLATGSEVAKVVRVWERRLARRRSSSVSSVRALKQDRAMFGAVRWRRRKRAHRRRKPPFLDVGLDEDEACLAKVDVHRARVVGADRWEQVVPVEADERVLELLAVPGEEDRSCAWTVADSQSVALLQWRAVRLRCEGVRVALEAVC